MASTPINKVKSFNINISRITPEIPKNMREVRLKEKKKSDEVDIIVLDDNDETPSKKKISFEATNKE